MAKANTQTTPVKLTAAEARTKVVELQEKLDKFKDYGYCYMCDTHKSKDKFHVSTDPLVKSGISPICKLCASKIALRVDKNGEEHECTRDSMIEALYYLNKPFITTVWNASIQESENLVGGKIKTTPFHAYVKNIAMRQYVGMTYRDSDFFKERFFYEDEKQQKNEYTMKFMTQDSIDDYEKNKNDVVRLLGYDPFEEEQLSDQPALYSQLLGLIDAGGDENDDMMRNASCVSIVRGFLQSSKIDNAITNLMSDIQNIEKNSAAIKSLQDSKQKLSSMITNLAAESCISLKNNKNAKKGENTWTGKIKKIKDLDLREGRVNGFDMETCKAMRQVMDSSHKSIMQELKLDDSDWSEMVAEQRELIVDLQDKLSKQTEIARILLTENLDLKDFLEENQIDTKSYSFVNLEDLYSNFSAPESDGGQDEN